MNTLDSRREYYNRIEFLADCIEEDADQMDDRDDWHDNIIRTTADADLVQYHALDSLRYSHKEPTGWMEENTHRDDWMQVIADMAYVCVRRDLIDELEDRGGRL
jgi:iron uptake system EfeUOB component EfeO/EfeM